MSFGVLSLVFATGAGANVRKSIGITVVSGMLASTCIAVAFVPSFFVVLQRPSERRGRKAAAAEPATVPATPPEAHDWVGRGETLCATTAA